METLKWVKNIGKMPVNRTDRVAVMVKDKLVKSGPAETFMWLVGINKVDFWVFEEDYLEHVRIRVKDADITEKQVVKDPGGHYRKEYKKTITKEDIARGYVVLKLDPARICQIYSVLSMCLQFVVKKSLVAGNRGHKSKKQDLLDIINAAERELEMMDEDNLEESN